MDFVAVSIQLGSPASGDEKRGEGKADPDLFPFNWDPQRVGTPDQLNELFEKGLKVSIQLGSPASGDAMAALAWLAAAGSFHSIGIPSEWGLPVGALG